MPNILEQYYVSPAPQIHGAFSLTLTNTLHHIGDPTWQIDSTLTVYDEPTTSQPQIEVSLTHE